MNTYEKTMLLIVLFTGIVLLFGTFMYGLSVFNRIKTARLNSQINETNLGNYTQVCQLINETYGINTEYEKAIYFEDPQNIKRIWLEIKPHLYMINARKSSNPIYALLTYDINDEPNGSILKTASSLAFGFCYHFPSRIYHLHVSNLRKQVMCAKKDNLLVSYDIPCIAYDDRSRKSVKGYFGEGFSCNVSIDNDTKGCINYIPIHNESDISQYEGCNELCFKKQGYFECKESNSDLLKQMTLDIQHYFLESGALVSSVDQNGNMLYQFLDKSNENFMNKKLKQALINSQPTSDYAMVNQGITYLQNIGEIMLNNGKNISKVLVLVTNFFKVPHELCDYAKRNSIYVIVVGINRSNSVSALNYGCNYETLSVKDYDDFSLLTNNLFNMQYQKIVYPSNILIKTNQRKLYYHEDELKTNASLSFQPGNATLLDIYSDGQLSVNITISKNKCYLKEK